MRESPERQNWLDLILKPAITETLANHKTYITQMSSSGKTNLACARCSVGTLTDARKVFSFKGLQNHLLIR